jgi:hypothetical protein
VAEVTNLAVKRAVKQNGDKWATFQVYLYEGNTRKLSHEFVLPNITIVHYAEKDGDKWKNPEKEIASLCLLDDDIRIIMVPTLLDALIPYVWDNGNATRYELRSSFFDIINTGCREMGMPKWVIPQGAIVEVSPPEGGSRVVQYNRKEVLESVPEFGEKK